MKTRSGRYMRPAMAALALLLAASLTLALIPAGTAQASSDQGSPVLDEGTPPQKDGEGRGAGLLEKALQFEQKANERYSTLLEKADQALTRLEEAIANGKDDNRDVSALEDVLEELSGQITAARAAHEHAAGLLAQPPGFDENDQITDRTTAFETVKKIRQLHQEIRKLIGDSLKDALRAVREFRQARPVD
jgi:hypothetical protein